MKNCCSKLQKIVSCSLDVQNTSCFAQIWCTILHPFYPKYGQQMVVRNNDGFDFDLCAPFLGNDLHSKIAIHSRKRSFFGNNGKIAVAMCVCDLVCDSRISQRLVHSNTHLRYWNLCKALSCVRCGNTKFAHNNPSNTILGCFLMVFPCGFMFLVCYGGCDIWCSVTLVDANWRYHVSRKMVNQNKKLVKITFRFAINPNPPKS